MIRDPFLRLYAAALLLSLAAQWCVSSIMRLIICLSCALSFAFVGCASAPEGVTIDDAFVLCVAIQQQLANGDTIGTQLGHPTAKVPENKQFPEQEKGHIQETPAEFELPAAELKTGSTAGTSIGSDEIEVLPRPASPAAVAPQPAPLLLYGYPGCEACAWIKRQFDLRGITYTYRSVTPVAGVTYPHATRDGKHLNYTELKELVK